MSLFGEEPALLLLARKVTQATGAPVLGGIAVFLHGYRRTTQDIDLFSSDPEKTAAVLTRLGARFDAKHREFQLEGVPLQLVTVEQTGSEPAEVVTIQGVKVVGLADLVRFKLHSGLDRVDRARDLADVVELIRVVPLDKRFAARLPKSQRAAFKKLVDAVRSSPGRRSGPRH